LRGVAIENFSIAVRWRMRNDNPTNGFEKRDRYLNPSGVAAAGSRCGRGNVHRQNKGRKKNCRPTSLVTNARS